MNEYPSLQRDECMGHEQKALYIDARSTTMSVDGDALRVQTDKRAEKYVPLQRIGRAVVTGADEKLLQACLEIVRRGGTVHFETPGGRIDAVLHSAQPADTDSVRELASIIDRHEALGPYHWWRDAQRRHAWSLVFRRGTPGDFIANRSRLLKHLRTMTPTAPVQSECNMLDERLYAWLQSQLHVKGLYPLVNALAAKGENLARELWQCLSLPLTWRYVRWRRLQPIAQSNEEITRFLELSAAGHLSHQLERHIRALASEYHTSWNLHEAKDEWESRRA